MERRIVRLVEKARKWARLKRKKNEEKKVAIVFHNYPPTNSSIGSASQIDSLESVRRLLARMKEDGYCVAEIPADTKVFIDSLTAHATNDRAYLSRMASCQRNLIKCISLDCRGECGGSSYMIGENRRAKYSVIRESC